MQAGSADILTQNRILIIGAGPAGLVLAAECCEQGLDVTVIDPAPASEWSNQYAAWVDELAPLGYAQCLKHSWSGARVWLSEAEDQFLPRAYGVLDNTAFRGLLHQRCSSAKWHQGRAIQWAQGTQGARVACEDGTQLAGDIVINTTGGCEPDSTRPSPTAFQTAYGILIEAEGVEPSDTVTFMDYRRPYPNAPSLPGNTPSFLYAMPWPDGRWFFEETVLISSPAIPIASLQNRLEGRLKHMGIRIRKTLDVEHCSIPMNITPPAPGILRLSYGAAAGMVHPATGYSIVETLTRAPDVARTLSASLKNTAIIEACTATAKAIWSQDDRQCHALYKFGSDVLATFNEDDTRCFLAHFFNLPTAMWTGYLSRRLSPAEIQSTMLQMFGSFPLHLKKKMVTSALTQPNLLVKGLFGE